ncbi:MAG: ROK family protein [Alistipes sp.]|jgi:glucokinase|nr:ROK family protein [Alistipes sp.]
MLLGIDLGGTNIRIGQIDGAELVKKTSHPSPSKMALGESLEYLKTHIGAMMTPDVEGIGIGVPSVVDVVRGIVYNATNIPAWEEVHLKDVLEAEFGVPVRVNNDANTFALGEAEYGVGHGLRDVVGVTLGTGVGAGIVIGGTLYSGRNTGAGEIGSLPYLDATLEDYCGSNFFSRLHGTTGSEAAAAAAKGDAKAQAIWDEFGGHMGMLMQIILFTYDPEAVIFGGGISRAWPLFERATLAKMGEFPYPETVRNIRIEISRNPDIQILGAAALAKGVGVL